MQTLFEPNAGLNTKLPFRELTKDEILLCAGGDNPGMGPYDGEGDQSLPSNCEWILPEGRVRCIFY